MMGSIGGLMLRRMIEQYQDAQMQDLREAYEDDCTDDYDDCEETDEPSEDIDG
jgi:hypothetical protein